ncbi:hypothetical protein ACFL16_00480 [Patescibacteria group bacterium]
MARKKSNMLFVIIMALLVILIGIALGVVRGESLYNIFNPLNPIIVEQQKSAE